MIFSADNCMYDNTVLNMCHFTCVTTHECPTTRLKANVIKT